MKKENKKENEVKIEVKNENEVELEKEYNVKFKSVSENEISITAKNRAEALKKAKMLFNTDLKDISISTITKYYYVIEINNMEKLVKIKNG